MIPSRELGPTTPARQSPEGDFNDWESLAQEILRSVKQNQAAAGTLGLSLSHSCPVRCAHCAVSCLPALSQPASTTALTDWLTQASDTGRYHTINVTGGEPFDHPQALLHVVATCTRLGMRSTLVSSAIWATSEPEVELILSPYARDGLTGIFISIDDFHLRRVPIQQVAWALKVAYSLGMDVGTSIVEGPGLSTTGQLLERLAQHLPSDIIDRLQVQTNTLVFIGRAKRLRIRRQSDLPASSNLKCGGIGPVIHETGSVSACCGPDLQPGSPLLMGNLHDRSFVDIDNSFQCSPLYPMIRFIGLREMLARAIALGVPGLEHWVGIPDGEACNLCLALTTNEAAVTALLTDDDCRRLTAERALLLGQNPILITELATSRVQNDNCSDT